MAKSREDMRRLLQSAALELFETAGYDETTAAQISMKVGVTERTFFRYFKDKAEVLFSGEEVLLDFLQGSIRQIPAKTGIWEVLLRAFISLEALFVGNRKFAEARQRIIMVTPSLQERAFAKEREIALAIEIALKDRGVRPAQALLASRMGSIAMTSAYTSWLNDAGPLSDHINSSFRAIRSIVGQEELPPHDRQPAKI